MPKLNEYKIIEVCSKCNKASCWYGEFRCMVEGELTTKMVTVKELRKNPAESEDYWSDEYMKKVYGQTHPFGLAPTRLNKKDLTKCTCWTIECPDCKDSLLILWENHENKQAIQCHSCATNFEVEV